MIVKMHTYGVRCDGCDKALTEKTKPFIAHEKSELDDLKLFKHLWLTVKEKHYYPDCWNPNAHGSYELNSRPKFKPLFFNLF